MNPFAFARRRPITTLILVAGVAACVVLGLRQFGVDPAPALASLRINSMLEGLNNRVHGAESDEPEGSAHEEGQRIITTTPKVMDVTVTQPYVCQIHSRRHIDVRALVGGYLQEIAVKEGQEVKQGDVLFKILPTLYQAKLDAEVAEAQLAELEYNNTKRLAEQKVVSENEVKLLEAKLAKAKAKVKLANAELNFTNVVAPFDGIVDRLYQQLGSLISEGDVLTTLSDNSVMWVYFNMPEVDYLEYMAGRAQHQGDERIELKLANGKIFSQPGKIGAIEAKFNNENGNLPFRADFPNPDRLLRHGQTGTILISRVLKNALVIPQRATFELLDKKYVYVVDDEGVAHQRLIVEEREKDDIFVIKSGLEPTDRIVLEGVREVKDGEKLVTEYEQPDEVLEHLKFHAE